MKIQVYVCNMSEKDFRIMSNWHKKFGPASAIVHKGNISFKPFMFSIPWFPNFVSSAIMKSFYHDH